MTRSYRAFSSSVLFFAILCAAPAGADDGYRLPPKAAVEILDIPPSPEVSASPNGQWLVITHLQGMPSIADRAVPMAALAGVRVNVRTNGPYDSLPYDLTSSYTGRGAGFTVVRLSDGARREIKIDGNGLGPPLWSPDSRRFAFLRTTGAGIELWSTDAATGKAHALTGPEINAARSLGRYPDPPCTWLSDSTRLLCHFVRKDRGEAPQEGVPAGPIVDQSSGTRSPVWTYGNLLARPYDEQLYDYYMTSQPAFVNAESGVRTSFVAPAIYETLKPAADGRYFLSVRIVRPYSYQVPAERFPKVVEVLDASGAVVRAVTRLSTDMSGADNLGFAADGSRGFAWNAGLPAALIYVEALDGGNAKQAAAHRDRLMRLSAPFDKPPVEVLRTKSRIRGGYLSQNGVMMLDARRALVFEYEWTTQRERAWRVDVANPKSAPALLWEHGTDDGYRDPGRPLMTLNPYGQTIVQHDGDWIFLAGKGGSPKGDYPFLDRFNMKTHATKRVFHAREGSYEYVVAALAKGEKLVTRYESNTEPPNYYLQDIPRGTRQALTSIAVAPNALSRATQQKLSYTRRDGVPLGGSLYLPAERKAGEKLPVIVWGYPLHYSSKQGAGQVRGSSHRFSGWSASMTSDYMLFLTQGYAVLADAGMPIVGGPTANDTHVEQLVDNARSVVDKLVEMGVADPRKIGVAGHSYGAFMTANLLEHSDLFATGAALSGAYNRTLTPFGFVTEARTYWDAPQVYYEVSPFSHADKLNEPVLLIHGATDGNAGTYPIQSQRLYHALKGLGATARLVMLPYEDHIYAARETRLDVLAEMLDWFDRYVKNRPDAQAAN